MNSNPGTNGHAHQPLPSRSEATIEVTVEGWEKPIEVRISYETPPLNIDRQMVAQGLINVVCERGFLGRRIKEEADEFEFAPITRVKSFKVKLSDLILVGSGVTLQ